MPTVSTVYLLLVILLRGTRILHRCYLFSVCEPEPFSCAEYRNAGHHMVAIVGMFLLGIAYYFLTPILLVIILAVMITEKCYFGEISRQ